jgi:uncharacterized protein YjiS (DUF1127 family)
VTIMDTIRTIPPPGTLAGSGRRQPWPARWASALFVLLLRWQDRAGQRHSLGTLDDRMLKDIGLTRVDVFREVRKPFWLP